jgi:hypothetical protein
MNPQTYYVSQYFVAATNTWEKPFKGGRFILGQGFSPWSTGSLFLVHGEAQQHGIRVQYNKVDHLTAPGSRKLENALLDSSLFHVYSTSATSLLDGTAFKKWSPKTLITVLQQKTLWHVSTTFTGHHGESSIGEWHQEWEGKFWHCGTKYHKR